MNGVFSWVDGEGWERSLDYEDDILVARIELVNKALGLEIIMRDVVFLESEKCPCCEQPLFFKL